MVYGLQCKFIEKVEKWNKLEDQWLNTVAVWVESNLQENNFCNFFLTAEHKFWQFSTLLIFYENEIHEYIQILAPLLEVFFERTIFISYKCEIQLSSG